MVLDRGGGCGVQTEFDERKKPKVWLAEKGARKDSIPRGFGDFLGSGVEAKVCERAVREIVIEGVRSKQVAVVIKGLRGMRRDRPLAGPNALTLVTVTGNVAPIG